MEDLEVTLPEVSPAQVLLVEDDSHLEEMLIAALVEDNIVVTGVKTGLEALRAVPQSRFDLILLDLGLPEMDGFEVLRQLNQAPPDRQVPVIVLTAWHATKDKLRSFELGAVDYITKPFELVELRARVRASLRAKRLQDQLSKTNHELNTARIVA